MPRKSGSVRPAAFGISTDAFIDPPIWAPLTLFKVVGNLVKIAIRLRPAHGLRNHRLIAAQMAVGRSSANHGGRLDHLRKRFGRPRRLDLWRPAAGTRHWRTMLVPW